MSYKTILVHADTDAGAENRIRLAAHLARQEGARLIGAAARLPHPLVEVHAAGTALLAAGMMDTSTTDNAGAFRVAEEHFYRYTADLGVKTEWRTAVDFPAIALADFAAAADLIVVGGGREGDGRAFDTGDLVMRAGRPVLTVPDDQQELTVRDVIVAWKNTREARRALSDALPFLKVADRVMLLNIRERDADRSSLTEAKSFLAQHGIAAVGEVAAPNGRAAGEQIIATASQRHTDLIVAGAFGHTRLREWAFGGVTRSLLGGSPMLCLFSR
jgi:nucleotide-binding universal stress UspA family protein